MVTLYKTGLHCSGLTCENGSKLLYLVDKGHVFVVLISLRVIRNVSFFHIVYLRRITVHYNRYYNNELKV